MLDESPGHNVENNKPTISLTPTREDGVTLGLNLGRTRQALAKKGGRKRRPSAASSCPIRPPPHHGHQKPQRSTAIRLSDHNNNNNVSASSAGTKPAVVVQPNTELPAGHHLKLGTKKEKKELLKSKGVRLERGAAQQGGPPVRNLGRHDQVARSHRGKQSQAAGAPQFPRKKDNSSQHKPSALQQPQHREHKKPLRSSDNVKVATVSPAEVVPEDFRDGEKVYAGAKFSEPPSPSVLPKPPSHWVGENGPQHGSHSREQMTVHLKSLLKVQGKS